MHYVQIATVVLDNLESEEEKDALSNAPTENFVTIEKGDISRPLRTSLHPDEGHMMTPEEILNALSEGENGDMIVTVDTDVDGVSDVLENYGLKPRGGYWADAVTYE